MQHISSTVYNGNKNATSVHYAWSRMKTFVCVRLIPNVSRQFTLLAAGHPCCCYRRGKVTVYVLMYGIYLSMWRQDIVIQTDRQGAGHHTAKLLHITNI